MIEEKVILAALEEIKLHSLRFTMDDITARLHMSKSSLYKLVPTKNKLVEEVVDYLSVSFNRQQQNILNGKGDIDNKVMDLLRLHTASFPLADNTMNKDLQINYPELWKRWLNVQQVGVDVLLELLREGRAKGIYKDVNLNVVRQALLAVVTNVTDNRFLQQNGLTYSEALETVAIIVLDGIRKKAKTF
ncbi:MAG: TetR/AcrR family transcriptional regulator [Acidaminococcaceae bacterium]